MICWFASSPERIFASASTKAGTAFVRTGVLPVVLLGKSSVFHMNPEALGQAEPQHCIEFIPQDGKGPGVRLARPPAE